MKNVRNLQPDELDFLTDMLYESIHIPENKPDKEALLGLPNLKKYSENWGRKGDRALVAFDESDRPIGAVWYRLFSEDNKGYGYVDNSVPELGIAVKEEARGMGVGKMLMKKIIQQAKDDGYNQISLSVDPSNTAAFEMYKELGFHIYGKSGTSLTMVHDIQ